MTRLLDFLLGTDPVLRQRMVQAATGWLLLAVGVVAMLVFVATGVAGAAPVAWWCLATLAGMAAFLLLLRSGWSGRLREPAMTVPQMIFALTSAAGAYAILGQGRGAVFPIALVVLMAGMLMTSPRQLLWVSVYGAAVFGATMAAMAIARPRQYPEAVEVGHFLLVATMMPAVALLAARLSRLRYRARLQRAELARALARLREHSTRDDLTGLANRRHMQEVLEREHQRCIRSGQTFCVALLDIDHFKAVNEAHGYAVGDAVLRAVAQEAQRHVRVADRLARWGGEEFLLMMPNARAALARGGLDRLHQRVAALRILNGSAVVGVTLSAGMAEHLAGETLAQSLERAELALAEAKAHRPGCVVVAA